MPDFIKNFIVNQIKDMVLKNWKTTVIGVISWVFAHFVAPKLGLGDAMQQEIMKMITDFILPLGIAAKDSTATGTVEQPRTDPKIVAAQNAYVTPLPYAPLADADRPPG